MRKRLILWFLALMFRVISHIDVEGYENLPETGAYVIASNHLGRLDVGIVFQVLKRDDLKVMVTTKYRDKWYWRLLVDGTDNLWVDRENADMNAIRAAKRHLEDGGIIVIAPEGTRSKTEALQHAKPGGIYLASMLGVPIVPVALSGTEDRVVVETLRRFRKAKLRASAGESFVLPRLDRKRRDAHLAEMTDEVMCRIAAQLPERYRGVYADHPRLAELLARDVPTG